MRGEINRTLDGAFGCLVAPFFLLAALVIIVGAYFQVFRYAIVSLVHKIVKKKDEEGQDDI